MAVTVPVPAGTREPELSAPQQAGVPSVLIAHVNEPPASSRSDAPAARITPASLVAPTRPAGRGAQTPPPCWGPPPGAPGPPPTPNPPPSPATPPTSTTAPAASAPRTSPSQRGLRAPPRRHSPTRMPAPPTISDDIA